MNSRFLISIIITLMAVNCVHAGWRSKVRSGDKLYEKGQYDEALVEYLKALEQEGDSTLIQFGLGNVLHAQEKFEDAGSAFGSSLIDPESTIRADAFYNMGNALFGSQKYEEAVQSYKNALKLKPGQPDYLHNLELALHLLENPPQQQQQNQDGESNQDQEQQNQEQSQDQQQQEQESEQQQQEEPSSQEQQQEDQQDQEKLEQQQQQAQPETMTKEDAERLLNALQTDEKQVQENLRKQPVVSGGKGKDW